MTELQVSILTPAKVVAKLPAARIQVPGLLGYLGILPGHTRLISEVGVGEVLVEAGSEKQVFFVSGGYVDVSEDNVTVLADVAERPGDIDKRRAEEARQRALDRLNQKSGVDVMRAQASLLRAEQRLMVAAGRGL